MFASLSLALFDSLTELSAGASSINLHRILATQNAGNMFAQMKFNSLTD